VVGEGAVLSFTVARDAEVGVDARVGPWATLPPGSRVPEGAVTGACFTGGTDDVEEPG
jgi:bifunctional UDP-N-acetylglucosamine pyrophosphorylase/glucosamine-1-phosphate N-acetyltransferase